MVSIEISELKQMQRDLEIADSILDDMASSYPYIEGIEEVQYRVDNTLFTLEDAIDRVERMEYEYRHERE